jgi:parallel beta-helix repeat protein
MKKAVSGIVLMLLLTNMLTLAVNILPVKAAGGTIYIRADGSVDPPDAPILNAGNLYYTFTADIYDCDVVVEKDNIVVDGAGYTIKGTGVGAVINITNRNSVAIKNVKIQYGMFGIYLRSSVNIALSGNTITNTGLGIYLNDFSIANSLFGNTIINNAYAGIMLDANCLNNSISGNYVVSNSDGIFLGSSSGNVISGNTIENNYERGIGLGLSSNNVVYHNNFINNRYQATTNGSINIWDSGYPSGGNYWTDYDGQDLDEDGIGDNPYVIDANNQDRYPLMKPSETLPPPSVPTPPVARFTCAPRLPIVGETVVFDASGSYDPDGNITAYIWDFGDGTSAEGVVVTHAYAVAGSYTVALTVVDDDGANATSTVTMHVLNITVASFSWAPSLPLIGETVIFIAENDYPHEKVTYMWNFGDGDTDFGEGWTTHHYNEVGTYTVTLTVICNSTVLGFAQQKLQVASWTGIYDRGAAYNYAQKYWNIVCSDGYFWEDVWRPMPLPNGTNISGIEGSDGAHFVSCCIGRERYEHGGMLPVPGQSNRPYGYNNAMELYSWLIQEGWAKEQVSIDSLKRGDIILYTRVAIGGGESHVALYLGDGKVASHTPSVWGADWRLGGEWDEYRFIHIIVPPVARFTYSPLNPLVGVTVTFDATSSYDLDGTIASYKWNFGDGTTATGRKVTHKYVQDGSYTIKLTVTDDNGNINSKTKTVTVLNRPPVACFTYTPLNPLVGQKVTFDASSSYDPYGKIVSYKWNFGDGYTGTGKIVTHTYSKAGQFTVKLTVTDNDGKSSSTSKTVTVVKPETNRLKILDKYYDIIDKSTGWTKSDNFWYLNYEPDGKKLPRSSVKYGKYTTVDDGKPPPAQCVDFVRVLSNHYELTSKWKKGEKVITCKNIEVGTVIATFFGEDGGYGGHTAVFAGFTYSGGTKTGFRVFDQNWKWDGCVGKHVIYTHGSDVSDADNYYIVTLGNGVTVKATCPVDLVVIDPDGLVITKEFSEIPEAIYLEEDFNDDGSLDDYIYIPEQKIGEYLITVVPEPDADPAATYTLEVSTQDATFLLAENVPISDIPEEPYVLDSTTFDTPPVTLLTIGEPQYTDPLNNIYVSSTTPFELTAEDNLGGSGVRTISYRIYNHTSSTDWLTYEGPFNLTHFADGLYFIDFNSTDYAGNVEPINTATVILDNTGPSVAVMNPPSGWALQDGVTFEISAIDVGSGVSSVNFSIREANGGGGTPVGFEDLPASYDATTGKWTLFFDTLQLPDGYYVVLVEAKDNLGNIGSVTVPYSIRNWAVIELLPASETNKAGRTMPVKFALRVATSVDPNQPFVYNEDLTIKIYATNDPSNILQTSTFGDTARDYRINTVNELYITNFKTLKTPTTYVVEVYRNEMLIDTFEFETVK